MFSDCDDPRFWGEMMQLVTSTKVSIRHKHLILFARDVRQRPDSQSRLPLSSATDRQTGKTDELNEKTLVLLGPKQYNRTETTR